MGEGKKEVEGAGMKQPRNAVSTYQAVFSLNQKGKTKNLRLLFC